MSTSAYQTAFPTDSKLTVPIPPCKSTTDPAIQFFTSAQVSTIASRVYAASSSTVIQVLKDNLVSAKKLYLTAENCGLIMSKITGSTAQIDAAKLLINVYAGGSIGDLKDALKKVMNSSSYKQVFSSSRI